jgi:hypothetical protein
VERSKKKKKFIIVGGGGSWKRNDKEPNNVTGIGTKVVPEGLSGGVPFVRLPLWLLVLVLQQLVRASAPQNPHLITT